MADSTVVIWAAMVTMTVTASAVSAVRTLLRLRFFRIRMRNLTTQALLKIVRLAARPEGRALGRVTAGAVGLDHLGGRRRLGVVVRQHPLVDAQQAAGPAAGDRVVRHH